MPTKPYFIRVFQTPHVHHLAIDVHHLAIQCSPPRYPMFTTSLWNRCSITAPLPRPLSGFAASLRSGSRGKEEGGSGLIPSFTGRFFMFYQIGHRFQMAVFDPV